MVAKFITFNLVQSICFIELHIIHRGGGGGGGGANISACTLAFIVQSLSARLK